jgi:hypothetical protein
VRSSYHARQAAASTEHVPAAAGFLMGRVLAITDELAAFIAAQRVLVAHPPDGAT